MGWSKRSSPRSLPLQIVVRNRSKFGDRESEIEMADRAVALNSNSFLAWHWRMGL
jgi:hypothetical protein